MKAALFVDQRLALAKGDLVDTADEDAVRAGIGAFGHDAGKTHHRITQDRQAARILAPFAEGKRKDSARAPLPMLKNEYAAALIETGKFDKAQEMLRSVLEDPAQSEFHPDAGNLTGIALDAQGHHKEAEKMFRRALDGWKGDPTSVMNNLSLNLASQGMFDEALTTLRRAQLMAPHKTEIARNIQIVSDLRDAVVPKAPVSLKK